MIRSERLLEQAENLIANGAMRGSPEDLRRAASAAYYALFHQCLAAATDTLVGDVSSAPDLYALAYRSVDHRRLRELCNKYAKTESSGRHADHLRPGHLDSDLVAYARMFVELHQLRASADYDPTWTLTAEDASVALGTARSAFARFAAAHPEKRRRFLILLHFPPR